METQVKEEVDKKEELGKKNLEVYAALCSQRELTVLTFLPFSRQMMEEIEGLQQRLREAEKQLEELKNSNREPSVHIVSGIQFCSANAKGIVPSNQIHIPLFPQ